MTKKAKTILLSVFLLLIIAGGLLLFFINKTWQQCDNAIVYKKIYEITSEISGEIIQINENNSIVKKGEIIAKINPEAYENKITELKKQFEKAQTDLKISNDDIKKIAEITSKNKKEMEKAKTDLENANEDYIRYKNAYQDGSVTKKDFQNAANNLISAKIQYESMQNNFKTANSALKSAISKKTNQNDKIDNLLNEINIAELELSYTNILSPTDGVIVNKDIKPLTKVEKSQNIISVISDEYYVIAEIKENKTIQNGQRAKIKINNRTFKGVVDSNENGKVKIIFEKDMSKYNFKQNTKAHVKIKK